VIFREDRWDIFGLRYGLHYRLFIHMGTFFSSKFISILGSVCFSGNIYLGLLKVRDGDGWRHNR
jgi:hypothetical protein